MADHWDSGVGRVPARRCDAIRPYRPRGGARRLAGTAKHVAWVLVVEGNEVTLVDTGYPGDRDRVIGSLARIG